MSSNDLVTRLRQMARNSSEALRMLAEAKSARQADKNDYPDLGPSPGYSWPTPEQTTEWQAANHITTLEAEIEVLREALQYIRKNGFSEPGRGLVLVAARALKGHKG